MPEHTDDLLAGQHNKACYIFTPRPSKRRKLENHRTSPSESHIFAPLLNGYENDAQLRLRYKTYKELWRECNDHLNDVLNSANSDTLNQVASFVSQPYTSLGGQVIPTAFITIGPSIATHGLLFSQLGKRIHSELECSYVLVKSSEALNLKAFLKLAIRKGTDQPGNLDEDNEIQSSNGRKYLNYDLAILHDFVQRRGLQRVVVAFQDGEAFDGALLSEIIHLFSSWLGRIPFVLLFGVATSISNFQDKLTRSALRHIHGSVYDVEQANVLLQRIVSQAFSHPKSLRLGPGLLSALLDRHRDHIQSFQAFIQSLKYAYMAHFFANPLSVLLADEPDVRQFQPYLYESVRTLPSFKRLVEALVDHGDTKTARLYLENDAFLHSKMKEAMEDCHTAAARLHDAVTLLHTIGLSLPKKQNYSVPDLYVRALSGGLENSPIARNALLHMAKLAPQEMIELLKDIASSSLTNASGELEMLDVQSELKSWHQSMLSQLPATQAQQASSSGALPVPSRITTTIQDRIRNFLKANCVKIQDLFLHEAFFYNAQPPHRDAFSPRPRAAIERALLAPQDYLNCECCKPTVEGLSSTQPATAILYQLYLESGALINVFDLWSAFYAVIGGEDGEDCDSMNALALFYRALADLKYMGMVKQTGRRPDHIAKLSWRGL